MPTGTIIEISREYLEDRYVQKKWSLCKIARELKIDKKTVKRNLQNYGVTIESPRPNNVPHKLLNREFDRLTVKEYVGKDKNNHNLWRCSCACGKETVLPQESIVSHHTRSCGCLKFERCKNNKFVGEVSGSFWNKVWQSAYKRGIPLEITQEYVWNLFLAQDRKCALSGIEITLPGNDVIAKHNLYTASLDRKDSKQGYIIGNVQWVHKHINLIKMAFDQSYFIELCQKVTEYQKSKNDN